MREKIAEQFVKFASIGGIGFAIDATVLTILAVLMGMNVYLARVFSFSLAVLVTWRQNRKYTFGVFKEESGYRQMLEYARYTAIQVIGALSNLAVFGWLIWRFPYLEGMPIVPLSVGALAGLILNFLGARFWVYKS
jgi:putative flippase GtrA